MRVAAGVLTWNPISNERLGLLTDTITSLEKAGIPVSVFDNGSTDEWDTKGLIRFPRIPGYPHANTCGYGMNKIAASLHGTADIIILSNDDIVWTPDSRERLQTIWDASPDNLAIISGLVEPTFALPDQQPWNDPVNVLEVGGERLLVRRSVPGGAWTYLDNDYPLIFPVSTFPGVDDVPACHRLTAGGYHVACVHLAEHAGVGQSTWGNASHDMYVVDTLDAVTDKYGL